MIVTNIENVLTYLYNLNPVSGEYCFRGQAYSNWPLIPSIHRRKLKRYETVIAESFLLYFLKDKKIPKNHIYTHHPIELLAMCQHYGIDTRLLDWSNDILVSLYFACEDLFHEDGALHVCNKSIYDKFDFAKFKDTIKDPLLIDTHIINPRLRSQSGCFMIWGQDPLDATTTETYTLEEYNKFTFEQNPIEKLIIPKELKKSFLEELYNKYGINHDSIYLNNEFSRNTEKEYERFKKISFIIIDEIIRCDGKKPLFNLNFNLGGCVNLRSMPEDAPNGFPELISQVIKTFNLD